MVNTKIISLWVKTLFLVMCKCTTPAFSIQTYIEKTALNNTVGLLSTNALKKMAYLVLFNRSKLVLQRR